MVIIPASSNWAGLIIGHDMVLSGVYEVIVDDFEVVEWDTSL